MFQTMSSETVTTETVTGWRIQVELDNTTLYGFGIGRNFTDHWNLNTDFLFGSQDWNANMGRFGTVTMDADLFLWDVNVDYNILRERPTPLVTAGLGIFNIIGSDANETEFPYNFGVGARWDISDKILLKAVYRCTWTEIDGMEDKATFKGVNASFGFKF